MITVSFYSLQSGMFSGKTFSTNDENVSVAITLNTPDGHAHVIGEFDHLSQRVDVDARDKALDVARTSYSANGQSARAAHEQRMLELCEQHEYSQQQQKTMRAAAIADAIANNRPRPRELVLTPFVEQPFIAPVWDEAAELHKATLAAIVDYQPPQPSPDHEWHAESKRWRLTAEANHRNKVRAAAIARIAELEIKQARRVRELLSQNDQQLKAIDDEIKGLRGNL